MAVLGHLEPQGVFSFFEQMCAIPHGSYNTKQISDWLVSFAKERGLEYHQDAVGNVIIIKEATPGYEHAEPIIFQGHMDMVCEKAADCEKNMETEGLDLAIDGDVLYAKGTTLGGDDGIAVAFALAIMDADDLAHPRFEAVFTVDEEVGMDGAVALDVSPLKGTRMMNMDSEEEGVLTVSCAGGNISRLSVPVVREAFDGAAVKITVEGLQGGHSGVEIHKGRGNASMLLGRLLFAASRKTDLRIVSVNGGLKDNAIPVSAEAVVIAADAEAVKASCAALGEAFRSEFCMTDPDVTVHTADAEAALPMDKASTTKILTLLTCAPNGIIEMSADIAGLVQTSLNLGVLTTEENAVQGNFCVRSSVESQKAMLVDRLQALADQLEGVLDVSGDYPGWEYKQNSVVRDLMCEVYREMFGKEPVIQAIHAGLECGLFCGKIPGLDCVSFGPNMADIHTCREKLYISSVQRQWEYMVEMLKRMR